MQKKCLWCGKRTPQLNTGQLQFKGNSVEIEVCSSLCEKKLRDFISYADSHIKHYFIGIMLSIILGAVIFSWRVSIDGGGFGILIIMAGMGATLIKYPFVTPQTVNLLGAEKAIASGRILGAINIILGIVFWIMLSCKIL